MNKYILVGTHHKSGTVWMENMFSIFAKFNGYDFKNIHIEKIKDLNIIVIKVIRPSIIKKMDEHISENEYENIPGCIELLNDGSIERFLENFELLNIKYKIID